jgi:hypothetical protein
MTQHECLADALAAAQGEFAPLVKDKTAKVRSKKTDSAGKPIEFAYKYADLADVHEAVTPALVKHGLAQTQRMKIIGNHQVLVSELLFKQERLDSEMILPVEGNDPQTVGKIITYYRRYALQALLGIATEVDDDGADTERVRQPPARQSDPRQPPQHRNPEPAGRPDFVLRRPADPLPPRATAPADDRGEPAFLFGKEHLLATDWLQAVSDWARDPEADPQALLAWWHSDKQKAERARFHKLKRELESQLEVVKQEVLAHEKPAGAVNGKLSPEAALRAG